MKSSLAVVVVKGVLRYIGDHRFFELGYEGGPLKLLAAAITRYERDSRQ